MSGSKQHKRLENRYCSSNDHTNGLRLLNKELLLRNAELVKRLNRMKSERDKYQQLFNDWKGIGTSATEALNSLKREKIQLCEELRALQQLQRADAYKEHKRSKNMHSSSDAKKMRALSMSHNILRFNYQQKENEMKSLLMEFVRMFQYVGKHHPEYMPPELHSSNVRRYSPTNQKRNKKRIRNKKRHGQSQSLYDINQTKIDDIMNAAESDDEVGTDDSNSERAVREKKDPRQRKRRSWINNKNKDRNMKSKIKHLRNERKENSEESNSNEEQEPQPSQIERDSDSSSDEVTTFNPLQNLQLKNAHLKNQFARSHSVPSAAFLRNNNPHYQQYRYRAVQLNMHPMLWKKRDSLQRRKRHARLSAIPSSTGGTPLTTPSHSRRGKYSDDDFEFEDDPHQKYLDMLGKPASPSSNHSSSSGANVCMLPHRTAIEDNNIQDIFSILKGTLPSEPIARPYIDPDAEFDRFEEPEMQDQYLVPLEQNSDSSD